VHNHTKQQLTFLAASHLVAICAIVVLLSQSTCSASTTTSPSIKTQVHGKEVTASILVDAPQETVFEEIRKERTNGPGMRKLISSEERHAVVEQRFRRLPILGTAVCTYEEFEQPYSRIDIKMLKSDKFKRFEGYWLLSPEDSGRKTLTTLSLLCDTILYLPFCEQITVTRTKSAVWKRLYAIKAASEKSDTTVAH
jgi:hypothetical protein